MVKTRYLLVASVAAALSMQAADWSSYHGPSQDGRSTESIATQWPQTGPKVLWKVPSNAGFSSFAVAGGRCATQELRDFDGVVQEAVVVRDASTGKELWAQALGTMKVGDGGDDGTKENRGGEVSCPSL